MAATPKDTIYIDIDDEITAIIDKLGRSDGKVVALVLPKRASVLQSIVNMKLLKRAADEGKKHVVLITAEAGLLPLAGMVGLHVAKSLTSKPEIPAPPTTDDSEETVDEPGEGDNEPEVTAATAGAKPVGELAGMSNLGATALAADGVETLELDDDDDEDSGAETAAVAGKEAKPKTKVKKDSKLKIPNFDRFRLLLVLGVLILILLIVGGVFALSVLPKATIAISTDATNINTSVTLSLNTQAKTLDPTQNIVPATAVTQAKTYTQQVATTGLKNEGNKASGSVNMSSEECLPNSLAQPKSIPAGTGVSSGGMTFITQTVTKFQNSGVITGSGFNQCDTYQATDSTGITAQAGGSNYNLSSATFTVSGRPDASATGSTTGGTDNNVQVVSQTDIDNAQSKITTTDPTVKQALQNQLTQQNLYAIPATFSAGTPTITNSANVGDAVGTVTVTEVVTYTMFGVHESDLKTLVDSSVNGQIDTKKQSILSEGLSAASFSVENATPTGAQLTMQTTATAGPQLNTSAIKTEVMGKKSGDIQAELKANPDVTGVKVTLSPFWVTTVPKKTSKITITIAKPAITAGKGTPNTTAP